MGCFLSKRKNINFNNEDIDFVPLYEKVPKDEFLCPECLQFVPEILNLHVDNKRIDFICSKCNKINKKSLNYQDKLKENNYLYTKCSYCGLSSENNGDIFSYCYDCKKDFCDKCEEKHKEEAIGHIYIIKINEKNNRCLEHYDEEIINFCTDCGKKICEKSVSDPHKGHTKINLNDLNKKYLESIEIIKNKNKELLNIIKFNKTIMNLYNKKKNNFLYLKSLKNIANEYKSEKERDSNDLKFVLNDFDNEIKNSEKESETIFKGKEFDFEIQRQEENLLLSKGELNDDNFKCISKIKFNNLREINLSENNITNIDLLCNISLPYLELLNLSFNQINNIEPLRHINSTKLKFLFIQNNQIKDFKVFLDYYNPNFKTLEILRLEENKIKEDSVQFINLEEKYKDIVISSSYINSLKTKYNIEYNENDDKTNKEIQIENSGKSDSILRYLFIIISHKNKNRITKLNLKSNQIENPSLLNRIQFDSLEELDLTGNKIKNLEFLKGMRAKSLKKLNLDYNYINDLSPLKNFDFKKVFDDLTITLKNNNFDKNDPEINYIKNNYEIIKLEF